VVDKRGRPTYFWDLIHREKTMTDRIDITEPEPNPDANVLDDAELDALADAEDAVPVEDDAGTSPEPPTEE